MNTIKPYAVKLQEAKEEFDAWDLAAKKILVHVGSCVWQCWMKARVLQCLCGKPVSKNSWCWDCYRQHKIELNITCGNCSKIATIGKYCSKCYWKQYNKTRVREKPRRKTAAEIAVSPKCVKHPDKIAWTRGMCSACYSKLKREERKNKSV